MIRSTSSTKRRNIGINPRIKKRQLIFEILEPTKNLNEYENEVPSSNLEEATKIPNKTFEAILKGEDEE